MWNIRALFVSFYLFTFFNALQMMEGNITTVPDLDIGLESLVNLRLLR